jgi:glutamate dehydrogenase (NAD(P)+)
LIPAALHNQIDEAEARAMNVSVVVEGANGPTTTEGDAVLNERGIDVIPDILANAGGVTVSYYEWVQNRLQERLDLEEVDIRLEKAMRRAYRRAYEFSRERKCSLREASYALALQRLAQVYAARGIFP